MKVTLVYPTTAPDGLSSDGNANRDAKLFLEDSSRKSIYSLTSSSASSDTTTSALNEFDVSVKHEELVGVDNARKPLLRSLQAEHVKTGDQANLVETIVKTELVETGGQTELATEDYPANAEELVTTASSALFQGLQNQTDSSGLKEQIETSQHLNKTKVDKFNEHIDDPKTMKTVEQNTDSHLQMNHHAAETDQKKDSITEVLTSQEDSQTKTEPPKYHATHPAEALQASITPIVIHLSPDIPVGIEIDLELPLISLIHHDSPLKGRVNIGDILVYVDDIPTAGLNFLTLNKLLNGSRILAGRRKLTNGDRKLVILPRRAQSQGFDISAGENRGASTSKEKRTGKVQASIHCGSRSNASQIKIVANSPCHKTSMSLIRRQSNSTNCNTIERGVDAPVSALLAVNASATDSVSSHQSLSAVNIVSDNAEKSPPTTLSTSVAPPPHSSLLFSSPYTAAATCKHHSSFGLNAWKQSLGEKSEEAQHPLSEANADSADRKKDCAADVKEDLLDDVKFKGDGGAIDENGAVAKEECTRIKRKKDKKQRHRERLLEIPKPRPKPNIDVITIEPQKESSTISIGASAGVGYNTCNEEDEVSTLYGGTWTSNKTLRRYKEDLEYIEEGQFAPMLGLIDPQTQRQQQEAEATRMAQEKEEKTMKQLELEQLKKQQRMVEGTLLSFIFIAIGALVVLLVLVFGFNHGD